MDDAVIENWRYREHWIGNQLRDRGWSEKEIKRGERYRRSEEYLIVGAVWCLFVLPAPIGLSLIAYSGYVRYRYKDIGHEYTNMRRKLKREFDHREVGEPPGDWFAEETRWADRSPLSNW